MMGATLSRWTMAYFVAALLALVCGEALMVAGYGFPSAPLRAPQTLVTVHVITIGWLSLLMCGALFQFVPVLIAHPLHSDMLPLPALIFLLAGLGGLVAGFLQLAGALAPAPLLLPWAAGALAIGFLIALYNLGRTLMLARPLPLPARFVAIALVCLVAAATLGVIFSFALSALVTSDTLAEIAARGLPLHIVAGLGGWLTFTAMGVTYRLLAMFMLAPENEGRRPQTVFWSGTAALGVAIAGGIGAAMLEASTTGALLIGAAFGLVALGLYGADIARLYKTRKRPVIELNSRMAAFAVGSLAATAALALVLLALGQFEERAAAVVFLAAFGWLSGLGLAKLYKIVAFLTWLECYGPILGKAPTPRVQDLVVEPQARPWFIAYYIGTWAATAALLVPHAIAFRIAAALMLAATVAIVVQLARIRTLVDVKATARLADRVARPHLLFAAPAPRR